MQNGEDPAELIRFGVFESDLRAGELRKHGLKLKLQEQPFRILAMLLERPGQVVTREDLQKSLWAGDTFIDFDSGLNKAMNRLRETLGDTAENPRFIETLPKRGYRFIAPVEKIGIGVVEHGSKPGDQFVNARSREKYAWGVAVLLLVASMLAGFAYFRGAAHPAPPVRSWLLPPPNTSFLPSNFELSPDGTRFAFVASGNDGNSKLWVRILSTAGLRLFNGTDGARFPFWSPDSRSVGFFGAGKLKTLDVATGEVHALCDAPAGMGGTWSCSGIIVFAPNIAGPLYRIAASGGTPAPVTPIPSEGSGQNHTAPWFLPDGNHFLYSSVHSASSDHQGNGVYIGSLGSGEAKLISSKLPGKMAFSSGHLLFVRESSLVAQKFDLGHLEMTGPPVVVAEQELEPDPGFWGSTFSVSQTGMLVFQSTADTASHLVWTDQSGRPLGQILDAGYRDPSFSPDGRLLAVSSDDAHSGRHYIRVYDLARGVSTRLTNGGSDTAPVWSRNGKEITYASREGNLSYIYRVAADGSSSPQVLLKDANIEPSGWSRADQLLLGRLLDGHPDLAVYSIVGRRFTQFARGVEGQVSPDGKWIAYMAGRLCSVLPWSRSPYPNL
jgi:DNA-binding winged helix-turn-helix (wHTH) protein/WD40 repeat protein